MRVTLLLTVGAAFILSCGAREQPAAASAATPPHAAPAAANPQQVAELTKRIDELAKRVEAAEKAAQDANARASAPVALPPAITLNSVKAKAVIVVNDANEAVASIAASKAGDGASLTLNAPHGGYTVVLEATTNAGGVVVYEPGGQRAWTFPTRR